MSAAVSLGEPATLPTTVAPEERGTTVLADRVVEQIAAAAAAEVDHAGGLTRRLAGRALGSPAVRVSAELDGHVASLSMRLAVEFPVAIRPVTRAVRSHVTDTVARLCDVRVDHVDIVVADLRRPDEDRRRVR